MAPVHSNLAARKTDVKSLKIQIVSDLHIEFYGPDPRRIPDDIVIPRAPVLALVGDIGLAFTESLRSFLHMQASHFEHVIFLAGNHEFYNHSKNKYSISEQIEWMKGVCSELSNLHFLERQVIELYGVKICATTLWSEIPTATLLKAEGSMNDYNLCYSHARGEQPRKLKAIETRHWHRESVKWLETELEKATHCGLPVLVLTHHTPLMLGTSDKKYEGTELNCCFSSDLTRVLSCPSIKAWACGHTHYNFDMLVGRSVRLVSNQRGYPASVKKNYHPDGIVLDICSCP